MKRKPVSRGNLYFSNALVWFFAGIMFTGAGIWMSMDVEPIWVKWLMAGLMLSVVGLIFSAMYDRSQKDGSMDAIYHTYLAWWEKGHATTNESTAGEMCDKT